MAVNSIEHEFLWKIENFSAITEDVLRSPGIIVRDLDNSHWFVYVAPKCETDDQFISVHLFRSSSVHGPSYLRMRFEICLIDVNGVEQFTKSSYRNLEKGVTTNFRRFVKRSLIYENKDIFLPNDVLSLLLRARKPDGSKFHPPRSVILTKIHVERSTFLWTIRGPTRKASANTRVIETKSSATIGTLELSCEYCNTISEQETDGKEHVLRFAIRPRDVTTGRILMSARILSLDSRLDLPSKLEADHFFEAQSSDPWHLPGLDISDITDSFLERDQLDLSCDISISDGSQSSRIEETSMSFDDKFTLGENTLQEDIRCVYKSIFNTAHDILVDASGDLQLFSAHKVILSARSLVFREILKKFDAEKKRSVDLLGRGANRPKMENAVRVRNGFMEVFATKGGDHVRISHISANILGQMLECMYTDTLNPGNLIDAINLYTAGAMFDFTLMREKSESYLISKISLKTVLLIQYFAKYRGMDRLKRKCLNFLSEKREIILASNQGLHLVNYHECLMKDI